MSDHCHHFRVALAAHPMASVERCACGAIHLTIGAVTLRLQADAFVSIAEPIADAARRLVIERIGERGEASEVLA
jgi:hypothetical protein